MKAYGWQAYQFDYSNPEDLKRILDLIRFDYGETDKAFLEYFRWEYEDNPAGKAVIWLAKYKDEVIGQYIVNLMRFKIGEAIRTGAVAVNVLVREDFRKKGVYIYLENKTYETCTQQGVDFTYGFPNKNVYKTYIRQLREDVIGTVPLFIKPVKIRLLLEKYYKNKFIIRAFAPFLYLILKVKDLIIALFSFSRRPGFYKNYNIRKIEGFDNRINSFWWAACEKYKNIMVRDMKFLNWRYFQNPRRKYEVYVVEDANQNIRAYVALRVALVGNVKTGFIVDMLSIGGEDDKHACHLLIRKAKEYFRKNSVYLIACLLWSGKNYYHLLKENGFFVCPRKFVPQPCQFVLKTHSKGINKKDIIDPQDWFISLGDFDIV